MNAHVYENIIVGIFLKFQEDIEDRQENSRLLEDVDDGNIESGEANQNRADLTTSSEDPNDKNISDQSPEVIEAQDLPIQSNVEQTDESQLKVSKKQTVK